MESMSCSWRRLNVFNSQRKTNIKTNWSTQNSVKREFSSGVRELIPTAVSRSSHRRRRVDFKPNKRQDSRNRQTAHENSPKYRDWDREFGKPVGDSRPPRRISMGPLLMQYEENPSLETLTSLIVVEGIRDWMVVKKSVNAPIFVCDGTSIEDRSFHDYVKQTVSAFEGDVIALLDPDTAGRRMRTLIHTLMKPCNHAFVSEFDSVIGLGTVHESIGVQHCSQQTIRNALKNPKLYSEKVENEIQYETLYEMKLVQSSTEKTEGVRLRRRFFCGFLGIGFCDGKQLLKQLNRYNFTQEDLEFALSRANVLFEEYKLDPWKLQKDYAKGEPRRTS